MASHGPVLFDAVTALVLALTLATAAWLWRARASGAGWLLAYWTVVAAYSLALAYSLSRWWVLAGILCAILLRGGIARRGARLGEAAVLAYVVYRSVGLLLDWPQLFFDW